MEIITLILAAVALIIAILAYLKKPQPSTSPGVDHSEEIKKLRERISDLENKCSENSKRIDDQNSVIEQLKTEIESIKSQLEVIEQIKTEIENIKQQIETITVPDVEFIKMSLAEFADNAQRTFLGDDEIHSPWNKNVTHTVHIAVQKES